jgi:CrcB protein
MMMNLLLIAIGGAAGSLARYGTAVLFAGPPDRTAFPWGTFAANLIGCLLVGYVNGLLLEKVIRPEMRFLLTIGFIGGFTTFSTFGYETARSSATETTLARRRTWSLSNIAGIALVFVGLALARLTRT